ncbi:hypothetical protein QBC44DRAFT_383391 [Cladorrhinum sp. PSN332]|nr:hypothetical protein QBC44DRAFT_383391 [Cladorrhinum sp. PSN332]
MDTTPGSTAATAVVDEDGDLILRIGAETTKGQRDFQVCSSTMRRCSQILKAMLFGGWKESKPDDGSQWIVDLPVDDPASFQVLLSLMHAKFAVTETLMTPQLLHSIMITVDKYNLWHIIRPFAQKWEDGAWFELDSRKEHWDDAHHDDLRLLHIAWLLGNEDRFSIVVRRLVYRSPVNPARQLVYPIGDESSNASVVIEEALETDLLGLPSNLERIVAQKRFAMIEAIIDTFHKPSNSQPWQPWSNALVDGFACTFLRCDTKIVDNARKRAIQK